MLNVTVRTGGGRWVMGGKTFDGISQKFVYKLLSSNSPQTSGFGEWVIRDKLFVRCGQISYSNVVYCKKRFKTNNASG